MSEIARIAFIDLETTGPEALRNSFIGDERLYRWHEISGISLILADAMTLQMISKHFWRIRVEYPLRSVEASRRLQPKNPDARDLPDVLLELKELVSGAVLAAYNICAVWRFLEPALVKYQLLIVTKGYIDVGTYTKTALRWSGIQDGVVKDSSALSLASIDTVESVYRTYKTVREVLDRKTIPPPSCCQEGL